MIQEKRKISADVAARIRQRMHQLMCSSRLLPLMCSLSVRQENLSRYHVQMSAIMPNNSHFGAIMGTIYTQGAVSPTKRSSDRSVSQYGPATEALERFLKRSRAATATCGCCPWTTPNNHPHRPSLESPRLPRIPFRVDALFDAISVIEAPGDEFPTIGWPLDDDDDDVLVCELAQATDPR